MKRNLCCLIHPIAFDSDNKGWGVCFDCFFSPLFNFKYIAPITIPNLKKRMDNIEALKGIRWTYWRNGIKYERYVTWRQKIDGTKFDIFRQERVIETSRLDKTYA